MSPGIRWRGKLQFYRNLLPPKEKLDSEYIIGCFIFDDDLASCFADVDKSSSTDGGDCWLSLGLTVFFFFVVVFRSLYSNDDNRRSQFSAASFSVVDVGPLRDLEEFYLNDERVLLPCRRAIGDVWRQTPNNFGSRLFFHVYKIEDVGHVESVLEENSMFAIYLR